MGHIVGELNLNKTPQLVKNNSLVFAKNIRLLKDGTISRDTGLTKLPLDLQTIAETSLRLSTVYETESEKYAKLGNTINIEVDEFDNIQQLKDYISIEFFATPGHTTSADYIKLYEADADSFTYDNYGEVLAIANKNSKKFPLVSPEFFNKVARNDIAERWHPTTDENDETKFGDSGFGAMTDGSTTYDETKTYYKLYYDIVSSFLDEDSPNFDSGFFNTYFYDYRPYENLTNNTYSQAVYELLSVFVRDFSDDIVNCLSKSTSISSDITLQNNSYKDKIDKYLKLSTDYSAIYTKFNSAKSYKILGYIPYNTKFYLFLKLEPKNTNNPTSYSIVCYDEHTNEFVPINCNWRWSGGKITGHVITNLNGDVIINIGEYKDDDTLIPFKSININKSSVDDNESIYTQTPTIPVYNLIFRGYHTTPIPNGVYQFFIRYQIRDDYYTAWYPASKELFAGSKEIKKTNQGQLEYINLEHDAGRSFVFDVQHVIDVADIYTKFQIGFIISHDDENYARSWKHFDISTTTIEFDYDQAYIKEIDIADLTESAFQIYNVQNIASFKDKLYIANYKETDFNPNLQSYADAVKIDIQKETLDYSDIINNLPVTVSGDNITKIDDELIIDVIKNLVIQSASYITETNNSTENTEGIKEFDSGKGIKLRVTKTKVPIADNVIFENKGGRRYWSVNFISSPYGDKPGDVSNFYTGEFAFIKQLITYNKYPIHLGSDDSQKFMYCGYTYNSNDTYKGFANALNAGLNLAGGADVTDSVQKRAHLRTYNGYKTWALNNYIPNLTTITDISGGVEFSEYIDDVLNHIFANSVATINGVTKTLNITNWHEKKFWYIAKIKDGKALETDAAGYASDIYSAEGITRVPTNAVYTGDVYEIQLEVIEDFSGLRFTPSSQTPSFITINETISNLTTLLPYQTYKFFIHYMNKNGEITNGYQIGDKDGITIGEEPPNKIIYPSFSHVYYPAGYDSCFISIQHYKTKLATLFDIKTIPGVQIDSVDALCANCIDLDARLVSPVTNLPIVRNGWASVIGSYHGSFDSTYLELFGSNGKVVYSDPGHFPTGLDSYAYLKLDYTSNSDDTKLTKCTPFFNTDSYNDKNDLNLLGYLCHVRKLNDCIDYYYSDTEVFAKTINHNAIILDAKDVTYDIWGSYNSSPEFLVYSDFNLNYLSLTLDVIAKVKTNDYDYMQESTAAIVAISSVQLSDIYELKSMYRSYSKRYFYKTDNKSLIKFDNTVRSSKLEGDEASVNIYRFETGDYYNIPTNKGKIVNLVASGEAIIVHTQDAIFKFAGSNTITANGGEDVALKENQPFESGIQEMFGSQYGYGGLQNKRNSIVTQAGYFFYDADSNIIYGYSGDNKLGELSSPIEKLMNFATVVNIDFACDFYNDRLFINLKLNNGYFVTLSYNIRVNSFVSLHDFDYDYSITTKDKCYFLNDKDIYVVDDEAIGYKGLDKDDRLFPYRVTDKIDGHYVRAAILDVIYNDQYQQPKVLESIQWVCKAIEEYGNTWKISERMPNAEKVILKPFMAEEFCVPYSGEWLRIYSDLASTALNYINTRANDYSIYKTEDGVEVEELYRDDSHKITGENAYKYPRFNLGSYSFNYFRNILNNAPLVINSPENPEPYKTDVYTYVETSQGIVDRHPQADNKSLIYGRYFVGRFILSNRVNFKLENVMFITTPYK